jgi:hypothetical protein
LDYLLFTLFISFFKDEDLRPKRAAPGQVPDISQFLDDNKGRVDRDPDGLAYDDLRHYAYEGDGNSMGSLSSLASGSFDSCSICSSLQEI